MAGLGRKIEALEGAGIFVSGGLYLHKPRGGSGPISVKGEVHA
jgi:hypothetical protein